MVKILCFHCGGGGRAGGPGSIPGLGTKIPHAMWWGQKTIEIVI